MELDFLGNYAKWDKEPEPVHYLNINRDYYTEIFNNNELDETYATKKDFALLVFAVLLNQFTATEENIPINEYFSNNGLCISANI